MESLQGYGCNKLLKEIQSGAKSIRIALHGALEYLREGDKLIVTKIDRLARSVKDLHNDASQLEDRGIGLVFLKEQIDFSTPSGKLMFTMLGEIVEFERELMNERTAEGRARSKKQGKHMGRPGQPRKNLECALDLFGNREENKISVNDIVKMTVVPRSTIYANAKDR
ncbi:resolvase [Bacillus sp. FJAT-21352]|nr:resolvase [Bacillus sp. FJAT-21352]